MSRILLFFALCIICPINSLGICGEAYQDVDSHTRSEVSVRKSGSGINVGAWLASFFGIISQQWTVTGARVIPPVPRIALRPLKSTVLSWGG